MYVVATPIGNLADISQRALEALRAADAIACEDTRHTRHLLDHFGIRAAAFALHEHNEREAAERVIALLAEGKRVALVSDAGTPGISDPGAKAVAAVRAAGYRSRAAAGAERGQRRAVGGGAGRRAFSLRRFPAGKSRRPRHGDCGTGGHAGGAGVLRGAAPHRGNRRRPGRSGWSRRAPW